MHRSIVCYSRVRWGMLEIVMYVKSNDHTKYQIPPLDLSQSQCLTPLLS